MAAAVRRPMTAQARGPGISRAVSANKRVVVAAPLAGMSPLWVHTCTGDSPQALIFYQACGFKPYKRAIEVAEDPRLQGLLGRKRAPHVPVIE